MEVAELRQSQRRCRTVVPGYRPDSCAMNDNTVTRLRSVPSAKAAGVVGQTVADNVTASRRQPAVVRIQGNILAVPERRLLSWLCSHLPGRIMPDHLTAIGFAGTAIIVTGYAMSSIQTAWLFLAILGYAVNWFGDSLDGSLARYRRIERPAFGYFIDHSLDAIGNLLTMIGFGLSPFVRMDVALLAASAYLLLSAHTFLAARVSGTFRLSYGLMGPTELRLLLIILTFVMWLAGPARLFIAGYSVFDLFTGASASLLLLIFARQTFVLAKALLEADDPSLPL